MIILGIDPGLATIGYGVIKRNKTSLECLECDIITTLPSLERPERLKKINNDLSRLIKKHKPDVLVMENIYFFKNLKTAIPVSQACGVIMLTAAKNKIPVSSFTPLQVKMAITGFGRAEKIDVQKKIKKMIKVKKRFATDDAADALAVAMTYIIKEA